MRTQSQTIGPYALEKRLGAGGMGEVYQAYDQRLDRWVAVKLIRPEHMDNATTRERFRREARAAARLSHPSIVQIYDIVESEESDAIVLELIEGEPLSRRISRGPLPVEEAVRLGRQIAEGLAAAHTRGIIHRDLKPENVMVTQEGHAKILDFGLAKRLEGEASLTEDHRVIGTFRSMSPEQAQGLALDHRSDLFSLGTLLYEVLSGRSPFDGGSTLETLTRICTHRQRPLREIVPTIPEELSLLVDHLLEKDPGLRPESAREVVAALEGLTSLSYAPSYDAQATWIDGVPLAGAADRISDTSHVSSQRNPVFQRSRGRWRTLLASGSAVLVLLAGVALYLLLRRLSDPLYVAVPEPVVMKGKELQGVALLASGTHVALLAALARLQGVSPLAPELVTPVVGSPVEIARATAAEEVLTSRMECEAELCRISLTRVSGKDGRLLWTQTFTAPINQPYLLVEAAQAHLREGYPDYRNIKGSSLQVRPQDYEKYLRLSSSFENREEEEIPLESLLGQLRSIRSTSPRFLEVYLFESEILAYRFRSSRDAEDLDRAFELLAEARDLAPNDPRLFFSIFEVAILGVRLEIASEALHELERLQPGDPGLAIRRARLLDRQGRGREALALLEPALQRQSSWRNLFWAAQVENRQGEFAAARRHLEELLRRHPGHYTGLSTLAQIELLHGSPERAVQLYTELVRRSPQFEELSQLGLALFLQEHYPDAERRYREALSLEPNNPFAVLNLADVVLLLGREQEAAELYRRLLSLIERDPAAAASWQHFTVKAQALGHLGRNREAVAAIQEALRLAPDNPQAAYEVALVQTLIGDHASALFNAQRALQQGVEPVWFRFPWFDPLRTELNGIIRQQSAAP